MPASIPVRSVWQISAGPASRSYADVFLKHGVALIGPGDAGPWKAERDDGQFEGSFVRRFASDVADGMSSCCARGSRPSPQWVW